MPIFAIGFLIAAAGLAPTEAELPGTAVSLETTTSLLTSALLQTPAQPTSALPPTVSEADAAEAARWSVTPYFWASEIDGAVTARGNRVSGNVSFSDILDHLDLAALVHAERAGEGWSIILDTVSMWLSQDFDGPLDGEVDLTMVTIELASAYRLVDLDERLGVPVTIDGLGGVRYIWFETEIDTNIGSSRSQDGDLLDPLVGARGQWRITEGWWMGARADIGGFGIGSKLSWQLMGSIGWDPCESVSVIGGYRLLDIDYTQGDGNQEAGLDLQFRGPMVGVMFRF